MTLECGEEGRVFAFGDLDPLGDGRDPLTQLAGTQEEAQAHAAQEEGCSPWGGEQVIEGVDDLIFRSRGAGVGVEGGVDLGDASGEGGLCGPRTNEARLEFGACGVVGGKGGQLVLDALGLCGQGVLCGDGSGACLARFFGGRAPRRRDEEQRRDEHEQDEQ